MAVVKRIVCLANSRKPGGSCVAGIEIADEQRLGWIRPVSGREDQAVNDGEQRYEDASQPRVMDIIEVPLLSAQPHEHQQENWLLDGTQRWVKVGEARWEDLTRLADRRGQLWVNGHHTSNGFNDAIPQQTARRLSSSLRLFKVDGLEVHVATFWNRRRVQGHFRHCGGNYWLWITDPGYEREYFAKPNGRYNIGESFLTVSLSEAFEGSCYKLIAAIIERREVRA